MDLNTIEEDLFSATDALWPNDPDASITEATKFVMHDQLVQYITTHYQSNSCVRDALIFHTDRYFTDAILQKRDLVPDVPAHLSPAERRGLRKKWKHFVKQATKVRQDIKDAAGRELKNVIEQVGGVIEQVGGLLTQAICIQIGAAAGSLTALPAATAPAAPYVGTAVYFWCLDKGEKEIKKVVAQEMVKTWKSGGRERIGHHEEDRIEAPPGEEIF